MATHIRTIEIDDLRTEHFLSWLRKQQANGGRTMTVGMIGSRRNNPVELWLQEVTGDQSVVISAKHDLTYGGYCYSLSTDFVALLSTLRRARICREVSAWEMIQNVCECLNSEAYVFGYYAAV